MKHCFLVFFIISLYFNFFAFADSKDSLESIVKTTSIDTVKISALAGLVSVYLYSNPQKALSYNKLVLQHSEKCRYSKGMLTAYNNFIAFYRKKGEMDSAFVFARIALDFAEKIKNNNGISIIYSNISNIYYDQGKYKEAIDYIFKSLKIKEILTDTLGIAANYGNIGNIYQKMNLPDKALEYQKKALVYYEKKNSLKGKANTFNNIGNIYYTLNQLDTALAYFQKSLSLKEKTHDKFGIPTSLNNIGNILHKQKKYKDALRYFQIAAKKRTENNDPRGNVLSSTNAAETMVCLGDYSNAITILNQALINSVKIKSFDLEKEIYYNLSAAYQKKQDFTKAYLYLNKYDVLNDSVFNIESQNQIAEMQTKYESEKKQKQIDLLTKSKTLQDTEMKEQTLLKNVFIAGFILMIFFGLILFRSYTIKRKDNRVLQNQKEIITLKNHELHQQQEEIIAQRNNLTEINEELRQQKHEIEAQKDEIEAQKDIAVEQKNFIELQNLEITKSIIYAEKIQHAVLPSDSYIANYFPDFFVLYKPKDIVSGDFFRVVEKDNIVYIAVADCTGHGVPGAFMSMIGNILFNEIIGVRKISLPAEILTALNYLIKVSLKQNKLDSDSRDGMDIALCAIDLINNKLTYSGANRDLFFVKNKNLSIIEADRKAIGGYTDDNVQFTNHEIGLEKNDSIYLMSDGFVDQFGGEKNKKYTSKRFRESLPAMSHLPMPDQKTELEMIFENWKNINPQTDDVLVLGIRI